MSTTYMGYQLNEDITAGHAYIVRVPRSLSASRFAAATELIRDIDAGSAIAEGMDSKAEIWTVTLHLGSETGLRNLRFAEAKYGVSVERIAEPDTSDHVPSDDPPGADSSPMSELQRNALATERPGVTYPWHDAAWVASQNRSIDAAAALPAEYEYDAVVSEVERFDAGVASARQLLAWLEGQRDAALARLAELEAKPGIPAKDVSTALAEHTPACTCEYQSHFNGFGHGYQQAPAGARKTAETGPICDDCADTHYAEFVVALAEHTQPALEAIEQAANCVNCGHHRGAHFREGCDGNLTSSCPCRNYSSDPFSGIPNADDSENRPF